MIDHVFLDAVDVLSRALDDTLLVRVPHEDRLATDLLAGDLVWETSVNLPGDGNPPRVRADLTLDWSTWSQSAWRSWTLEETVDDPPELGLEVIFRVQRLAARPSGADVLDSVAADEPPGVESFERVGFVAEEDLESGEVAVEVAFEGVYRLSEPYDSPRRGMFGAEGFGRAAPAGGDGQPQGETAAPAGGAPEDTAAQGQPGEPAAARVAGGEKAVGPGLASHLQALGRWIASTLVRLGDVEAEFLPPDGD